LDNRDRYALSVILLAGFLFFPFLGARDFWAPVEPRYAEIARVMFNHNEWIVPTINGKLYTDKPILYFWLVLIVSHLAGGVNEWTVRLPAALGAVGAVLTTYLIGRDFFSRRIGFMAGAVLATSVRVIWEGRWAHLDMLFTFFFALSMYFAARAVFNKGNRNEMLAAYALMALATLTKGLIGVVLPALVLILFVALSRDWRLVSEMRLPWGILIFVLIAMPWVVAVNQATDKQWLKDFVLIHHIQRYTAGMGHREPFYYYLTTLPLDFLPWTLFAVPALFTYQLRRKYFREPIPLFFCVWFTAVFLFFTLSNTKRELYLLPLFPPMALFVANYIDDLLKGDLPQGRLYHGVLFFGFNLLWIGCLAVPVAAWFVRRDAVSAIIPFALTLACGGLCVVYFLWRRSPWNVFLSTTLTMVLGVMTAAASFLPFLDQFKSPRPFSLEVKRVVPSAAPLYIYADTMNDFNFYTEREVIAVVSARAALQELLVQEDAGYLLIKERDLERVGMITKERIVSSKGSDGRSWFLIALGARDGS
jgi:4-amino-4-deoxy-L-arabinose transferase-like glycosyltransferase